MTETKTVSFVDKSAWARGPWDDEPDRVEWRPPSAPGLACLLLRGPHGNWCGYVGVPPGHPAHGKGYEASEVDTLAVHGGLTYASPCRGVGADAICHVPLPGESDDVWWLGFDAGHAWDVMPEMDAKLRELGREAISQMESVTYKDLDYMRAEVAELARQLAAMVNEP